MDQTDPLLAARAAGERQAWQEAYDAAVEAGSGELALAVEADRSDLLADAAWWLGRLDDCIEARERAYGLYEELGEDRRAGQCAVWLYEHYCFKARPAIAGGWLRRARRALERTPECVEYGNLVLREVEATHGGGELERAADSARSVVELARRLRSSNLEAEALQTLGRVLLDQGAVADGMAHLDEAMLFAVEGRLSPDATGKVYCSLITACEELGDLRRVAEWTEATARWSHRHPFAVFPGLCRVHHASVLERRGEWAEAEQEARRACSELAELNVPNAAAAYAEIGEIRRRVGDLAGAEAAFRQVEELCGQPRAGMAMLRLAEGDVLAATAIITRVLDEESWNRLARAKLLPARAQIAIATGDLDAAADAVDELERIASDFDSPTLSVAALSARGRLQLAQRDNANACATLRSAVRRWDELGVPYEVATARMLLGQACRDADDEDAAMASFAAAELIFEQLGAMPDTELIRQLRGGQRNLPAGLSEREAEVLRLVASGHTNKEIAAQLYVSDKTVARHLSNIFTKLGVSSRSAATAFAFEYRIVERGPRPSR